MINRAAVILKYKAPFIQWVNDADPYKDNPGITLESENKDCTVYLILEDDAENLEEWISLNFIGVVRKTFRLRTVFLLQTLIPPSYFRNIIMTSGINSYLRVKLKTGTPMNRFGQKTEPENFLMNGSMWNVTVFL